MLKKMKFSMILVIILSLLISSNVAFAAEVSVLPLSLESNIVYGDVNGDRYIDSLDVALINNYILNGGQLSTNSFTAADVNGDKEVNSLDLSLIKQYILGVIQIFPVEKYKTWIPYLPKDEDIQYYVKQNLDGKYQIIFEITFPSSGYIVEYTDELSVIAKVSPDGTKKIFCRPVNEPTFWQYTGPSLTVITTKRLVYTLSGKGEYTFELLGKWYNFNVK